MTGGVKFRTKENGRSPQRPPVSQCKEGCSPKGGQSTTLPGLADSFERLLLELTHTLPADAELITDLLVSSRLLPVHPVMEDENVPGARSEILKGCGHFTFEGLIEQSRIDGRCVFVRQVLDARRLALFVTMRVE